MSHGVNGIGLSGWEMELGVNGAALRGKDFYKVKRHKNYSTLFKADSQ
jgi:hypothetical protein